MSLDSHSRPPVRNLRRGAASKILVWILVAIGVVAVVGVVSCAGISYAIVAWAGNLLEEKAKDTYANNPVLIEQIGEWKSCSTNLQKTGEMGAEVDGQVYVFDLKGSKGSGTLIIYGIDESGNYESAELETDEGVFELGAGDP